MAKFTELLIKEMINSLENNYINNYDEMRFGKTSNVPSIYQRMRWAVRKTFFPNLMNKYEFENTINKSIKILTEYGEKLSLLYDLLNDEESKEWLVKLIAFKILGHTKVMLPSNNDEYKKYIEIQEKLLDKNNTISANFLGSSINLMFSDLTQIGFPLKLYVRGSGIVHQFLSQQYNYRNYIKANQGDIVLDCGVCYGDTSLYFAHLVGESGLVVGFEFIPSNLNIINQNIELNPIISKRINIINSPLWNKVGIKTFYKDMGPASSVKFEKFEGYEGVYETTTIDQTCKELNLERVDFIKMDIEGAEPYALEGARETIMKYKPKLAISSYHSMDDFVNIPMWIDSLNLGYKIHIGHPTINWEETVVFAQV